MYFVMQLLQPVWQIVSSVSQTQKSLAAMERVFEGMEMPPDKPDRAGGGRCAAHVLKRSALKMSILNIVPACRWCAIFR